MGVEMSEWKEYKFSDVLVDESISYGIVQPGFHKSNGIPIVRVNNIKSGNISTEDVLKVDADVESKYRRTRLIGGELLITVVGSVGECAIVPSSLKGWNVARAVSVANIKENFDTRFVKYCFQSEDVKHQLYGNTNDTVQPTLNLSSLKEIIFRLPPLSEQKRIAETLSSFDDKIDLLHRQNKTLEALAETLFRQWFVEDADGTWEVKPLSELLEFVVDNRGKTAPTSEEGVPLIATNCIKNDNIFPIYEKVRYVSHETYSSWFRAHPKPGDIIFVNKGTPGCVNLVPEPIDFCIAQDMIALRVNKRLVSNYYLFLYFRSGAVQSQIENSSVGTTIPHLKKTDLLKFSISIPEINKLNQFDRIVEPLFLKINKNHLQIRALTQLRDALLPKLMSGEVRVND